MLFIDDDDSQVSHRHEDRRANTKNDSAPSRQCFSPLIVSGSDGQSAVAYGQVLAETLAEDGFQLSAEGNFRDKDQRAFSSSQCFRDQLEIDLGLTAPRHSEEEMRSEDGILEEGTESLKDLVLTGSGREGSPFRKTLGVMRLPYNLEGKLIQETRGPKLQIGRASCRERV